MAFFILTRFVLVKYSRAFVERPSQGTSSLASRLTTVSLDRMLHIRISQKPKASEWFLSVGYLNPATIGIR